MSADSARGTATTAFIGASAVTRELQKEAEIAARLNVRVLLAGERGVGKQQLARYIHAEGSRRSGPFVAIRCGGDHEANLNTRLFGTASSSSEGELERARGGVILLQDIERLTPALQEALVEYLACGYIGNGKPQEPDIQVIAATQISLIDRVDAGTFREDLYYLLNTMYLAIPPLRERREDVDPLLEHFTAYYARQHGIGRPCLTSEWRAECRAYHWPANVWELEHTAAAFILQIAHDGHAHRRLRHS